MGYEGRTPKAFVDTLLRHGVTRAVDVRQLPLSRRRGFSKTALAGLLEAHGIAYSSMRDLGTPADLRHSYRDTGDFGTLKKAYLAHLRSNDPAVGDLYDLATSDRCCLVCFEKDPARCHRSLLADRVARRNGHRLEVQHL